MKLRTLYRQCKRDKCMKYKSECTVCIGIHRLNFVNIRMGTVKRKSCYITMADESVGTLADL